VHDSNTLKDAQIHPENHRGLQVRISGWSWYFTRMEKNYQDEFIRRAEFEEQRV
jgi:formate C-acetyltransferase